MPTARAPKRRTSRPRPTKKVVVNKEEEVKSEMILDFSVIKQEPMYDSDRYPAQNGIRDGNTFTHTEKKIGAFW